MRVIRERLSICVCDSLPFGLKGEMWDLNVHVYVPDHCLVLTLPNLVCQQ